MAQIIYDPGRFAGLGASLGTGLGTGLGQGIASLAQHKLQTALQNQQRSKLTNVLQSAGYSPQESQLLSMYPPEIQFKMMQLMQPQEQQQQVSPLEQFSMNPQQVQQQVQQQMQVPQQQAQQLDQQMQSPQQQMVNKIISQVQTPVTQEKPIQPLQPVKQEPVTPKVRGLGLTPAQRMQERKLQIQEQKEQRIEQHKVNKEIMPVYRDIVKEASGAKEDDRRLGRMEELVNRGNLTRPRWHSFLNTLEHGIFGLGVNLHSLETADSQEFDKLSKEFLKNAKNIFGSRITDNDVRVFLKMVPDLSQSREGKMSIIHNMKLFNQGKHIKKAAADQVLRERGGKLPLDFESRIDEIAAPQLDKLASQFVSEERMKPKEEPTSMFDIPNPLDFILGRG